MIIYLHVIIVANPPQITRVIEELKVHFKRRNVILNNRRVCLQRHESPEWIVELRFGDNLDVLTHVRVDAITLIELVLRIERHASCVNVAEQRQ